MAEYTDAQVAEALDLLEAQDIWAACRAVGASHTTIYRWHAAHVRTLLKKDDQLAAEELAENQVLRTRLQRRLLLTAMAHTDRSDAAGNGNEALKFMTAAGIALDKYRLEMGESTSQTVTLTGGLLELEIQRLESEVGKQAPANT